FAQPLLVEVAGELVVIRQMLEALLLRLATGDDAPDAMHLDGPAGLVEGRIAAVMHPGEAAVLGAHAVFAVEARAARPMRGEALLAHEQVVGVEASREGAARADRFRSGNPQHRLDRAMPLDAIAVEIPIIGDVACSG